MIRVRCLTENGIRQFKQWLENPDGSLPPVNLLNSEDLSEEFGEFEIDQSRSFNSRQEFGVYLNERFAEANFSEMTSTNRDGLWGWLSVVYL